MGNNNRNVIKGPLSGKRVVITGSTGGIGREICRRAADMGAGLILADRNRERSVKNGEELQRDFAGLEVSYVTVDMSDPTAVKKATEELKELMPDVFIANAGVYRTEDRDLTFRINFISPYCMIRGLMPVLRKKKGRVVAVSSIAQLAAKAEKDDPFLKNSRNKEKIYALSKRYLTLGLRELFKNESEVSLSIVHPGICHTELMTHYPKIISAIIKYPMKAIFMSPKKASRVVAEGMLSDCGNNEWIGPCFCGIWGRPKVSGLKNAKNEEIEALNEALKALATDNL